MFLKLTAGQCGKAIDEGEFPAEIVGSSKFVAIVLTQSWCPQWTMMSAWLEDSAKEPETNVFFCEYDQEPFFEKFMAFKENVLGNRSVPYVRYYRDGVLVGQGNFVSRDGFARALRR